MKKLVFMLLTLVVFQLTTGTTYYVRTDGNDSNSGLENTPEGAWLTIQASATKISGGDSLLVADGDYIEDEIKFYNGDNTKNTPIVVKSANRHGAKIISTSAYHAMNLTNSVALTIDGFEITFEENTSSEHHGINLEGNWITIKNCLIHGAPFSGIQGYLCDNVRIENNIIYDNCKGTGTTVHENGSGISIYHPISHEPGKGFHIIIRNNIMYDNVATNNVGSTGFPTDGNGIIMDDFHCSQSWDHSRTGGNNYPYSSLIENNLIFNNGGRGVHVFGSDNVTVRNNTVYYNCWVLQDYLDPGEITVENARNNKLYNNIAVSLPDLERGGSIRVANDNSTTTIKNNLIIGKRMFSAWDTETSIDTTNKKSKIDTLTAFINPSTDPSVADFHLQSISYAIDRGTNTNMGNFDLDYMARPANGTVDIGCYEYGSIPASLPASKTVSGDFTLNLYPNPAKNNLYITTDGLVPMNAWVFVYNFNGQVIKSEKVQHKENQNTFSLNVADIPNGLYLVKLNWTQNTLSGKLIIQK